MPCWNKALCLAVPSPIWLFLTKFFYDIGSWGPILYRTLHNKVTPCLFKASWLAVNIEQPIPRLYNEHAINLHLKFVYRIDSRGLSQSFCFLIFFFANVVEMFCKIFFLPSFCFILQFYLPLCLSVGLFQCDQIGRSFALWATF